MVSVQSCFKEMQNQYPLGYEELSGSHRKFLFLIVDPEGTIVLENSAARDVNR